MLTQLTKLKTPEKKFTKSNPKKKFKNKRPEKSSNNIVQEKLKKSEEKSSKIKLQKKVHIFK